MRIKQKIPVHKWTPLDLKTKKTTRTRLNLIFFSRILKKYTPEKLHRDITFLFLVQEAGLDTNGSQLATD